MNAFVQQIGLADEPLQLKILCSNVRSKAEDDRPFAFVFQEWLHAVLAHIWCDSYSVKFQRFKKCPGIL